MHDGRTNMHNGTLLEISKDRISIFQLSAIKKRVHLNVFAINSIIIARYIALIVIVI